jgi:hypothetical protein
LIASNGSRDFLRRFFAMSHLRKFHMARNGIDGVDTDADDLRDLALPDTRNSELRDENLFQKNLSLASGRVR